MPIKLKIEALEVLSTFKGRFSAGVKIGAKYPEILKNFGIPDSVNPHIAKYPIFWNVSFLEKRYSDVGKVVR